MRNQRKIIAISEETGERRQFGSLYEAAKEMKTNSGNLITGIACNTAVKGWKVYDTPDNIRKRIAELEAQIKMLEE